MRNVLIMGICLIMLSACSKEPKKSDRKLEDKHRELVNKTIQKNAVIAEYRAYLNSVSGKIQSMVKKERGIPLSLEGQSAKDALLNQLDQLDQLMDNQRYHLALLEESIHGQELDIGSLRQQLKQMESALEFKENNLALLLDSLTDQTIELGLLEAALAQKVDSLDLQDRELNKAWFAFGTFEELKAQEVVEKKGGLLGLGSVKSLKTEFNPKYFTELDIRETTEIPILAKHAELVSSHPESSYEFSGEGQVSFLLIKDPDEFWKLSRHLAIIVK